ncbi:GNAT family N-acetyltransferase [Amycolatopsis cynarae]|uniref:GNAT family N-acetyltransferase n=1 Tax=Amycolatopsis cynarae TaxID=2995223 RepID=A0ABY7B4Z9_9PSEU|nr:GNAT family N-acetyltransferase [Amycolatopsis sp. HUAS 11-8]WAL67017.1 GNAT family N-acetyltransferase [Amycolatopsis sp. HUAS 11-8]
MWIISPTPVDHPDAVAVLRDYIDDVASRYYGRQATDAEIDNALAEDPSDDLVPPTGLFFVARDGGTITGCVGVRRFDDDVMELTRMFVKPAARGQGGGARLLRTAEEAALGLGASWMRLDTRHDLVEARALYARHGYREIEPYAERLYADHWFEKRLEPFPADPQV